MPGTRDPKTEENAARAIERAPPVLWGCQIGHVKSCRLQVSMIIRHRQHLAGKTEAPLGVLPTRASGKKWSLSCVLKDEQEPVGRHRAGEDLGRARRRRSRAGREAGGVPAAEGPGTSRGSMTSTGSRLTVSAVGR